MTLPAPGAPHIQNLVATMLLHGTSAHVLDLSRIARCQGFDPADLAAEFARQERGISLTPSTEVTDK